MTPKDIKGVIDRLNALTKKPRPTQATMNDYDAWFTELANIGKVILGIYFKKPEEMMEAVPWGNLGTYPPPHKEEYEKFVTEVKDKITDADAQKHVWRGVKIASQDLWLEKTLGTVQISYGIRDLLVKLKNNSQKKTSIEQYTQPIEGYDTFKEIYNATKGQRGKQTSASGQARVAEFIDIKALNKMLGMIEQAEKEKDKLTEQTKDAMKKLKEETNKRMEKLTADTETAMKKLNEKIAKIAETLKVEINAVIKAAEKSR